jgi:hypothetical protein
MNLLSTGLQFANIVLQCILVVLLIANFARRYVILLAYSVTYLSATLVGEYLLRRDGAQGAAYRVFYWRTEVALDLLLFLTVIILIYQALEDPRVRSRAGPLLAGIIAIALILPFIVLKSHVFSDRWFDGASQMLNFGAAMLNLSLWTALLLRKRRDQRLVGVSLGVGVAVTGAALAYGLLQLFASGHDFINLLAAATHTAGVLLWCRAFWPARIPAAAKLASSS